MDLNRNDAERENIHTKYHSKGELISYTKVMGTALLFAQQTTLGLEIKNKNPSN